MVDDTPVETGPAHDVVTSPRHPYTEALLASTLPVDGPEDRVTELPGRPPDLTAPPAGCAFFPRLSAQHPSSERLDGAARRRDDGRAGGHRGAVMRAGE